MSEPYEVTSPDDRSSGLRRSPDPAEAEIARLRAIIAKAWALTVPRGDEDLSKTFIGRLSRIREITAPEFYRESWTSEGNSTMPLTPADLGKRRAEKEAPVIKNLIAEIDTAILDHGGNDKFTWDKPPLSSSVSRAVVAAYEAAGWDVKLISDQRDGSYWEFTPKQIQTTERPRSVFS